MSALPVTAPLRAMMHRRGRALTFAALLVVCGFSIAWLFDNLDPCTNYRGALQYTRSPDETPVDLAIRDPQTSAALTLRIPKTFVSNVGNLSSGNQCRIGLETFWPSMSPAGPVDFSKRQVRDRETGDAVKWRPLTVMIGIEPKSHASWFVPGGYCHECTRNTEFAERPFGLRSFDDNRPWPRLRQSNGSYRNLQELTAPPLNRMNRFYFVDGPADQLASIDCTKGAVRCTLETGIHGFRATVMFNQDDLAHWRDYQMAARDLIERHTLRLVPAQKSLEAGVAFNPPAALLACAREISEIAGPDSISPALRNALKQRP